MLAFSVREALRQAAAAFGPPGTSVDLASPATPEAVYWAIEQARATATARRTYVARRLPGVVPDQPEARRRSCTRAPSGGRALRR